MTKIIAILFIVAIIFVLTSGNEYFDKRKEDEYVERWTN